MSYRKPLFSPCVETPCEHLNLPDSMLLQVEGYTTASEVAGRGTIENNIQVRRKQDMASLANSAEVQANGSRNSFGSFSPFLVAE